MGCDQVLGQGQAWGGSRAGAVESVSPRGGAGKLDSHSRLEVRLGFHWLEWGRESRGYRGLLGAVAFPSSSPELGALSSVLVLWP